MELTKYKSIIKPTTIDGIEYYKEEQVLQLISLIKNIPNLDILEKKWNPITKKIKHNDSEITLYFNIRTSEWSNKSDAFQGYVFHLISKLL